MKRNILQLLLATAFVVILSACGADAKDTQASLSVQLSWLDNIEFSGFYLAEANDYYSKNNLEVSLIPVFDEDGNYRDAIGQVTSGAADFAVTNSGDVLIAREAGQPIVAIMAIYQRHPLVFTSLADSNIISPQDLVNKTVHVSSTSAALYQSLLGSLDIDAASVDMVDRTDYTIQSLLNGDADVIDGWVITELAELNAQGVEVNTIYPFDYGIDMYADVIITTEDMVKNQPEVVQRFINATLQDLNDAVANPDAAAQATILRAPDIPADVVEESALLQVPLVTPRNTQAGLMTHEIWELTQDLMVEQGLMTEPLDVDAAYTLNFVNAYYDGQ